MNDESKDAAQGADETAERRDEVLKRMLNTPPKPHTPKPKQRPPSKGRVRKGRSRA